MAAESSIINRESPGERPGRSCPLHYRYQAADLARSPDLSADTLYVVGGLYGNRAALETLEALAARECTAPAIVFNGDFNWFNVDAEGFEAVNRTVLRHTALRGNVETELAGNDAAAGCGCSYPDWVGDAEVDRSNRILVQLRDTARRLPALRSQLAALPMHLVAEVGGLHVAIVHGDAHSLAGWDYAQELLADPAHRRRVARDFDAAAARVIASSHTCLPAFSEFDAAGGRSVLINNGAAGMPNFAQTHYGVITRIATRPAKGLNALYGTRLDRIHVDALPLRYDQARWLAEFNANWAEGSPAHASYYPRIVHGPAATMALALPPRGTLASA
jgi:hypothetical protein